MIDASTGSLKIIDFSVGNQADREQHGFLGSLPFAAPELLAEAPWQPKPVDIYAVGVFVSFLIDMQALFHHLGFALQLNDATEAIRSKSLPQLQEGVVALADRLRSNASPGGDLSQLINITPQMRPTAGQALAHTWLT